MASHMATHLVTATERLIEAALKDGTAAVVSASKDAAAELKHIHSLADKLNNCATSISEAISAQTRILSIQGALFANAYEKFAFTYRDDRSYNSTSSELVKAILMNALRGQATSIDSNSKMEDASTKDSYGRTTPTPAAFRTKLVDHVQSITGIKPTLEVGTDGKTYYIRL